jgi:16S rRNA (uracil1498-N3)-methyltransferase
MRKNVGEYVNIFNASGEWLGRINNLTKNHASIYLIEQIRKPEVQSNCKLELFFAPVKNVTPSFIVQKATELGVDIITPIVTERSVLRKVRDDKLHLVAVEAAEQCNRLTVPDVNEAITLKQLLSSLSLNNKRRLLLCDERGKGVSFISLANIEPLEYVGIIVGPEGGLSKQEFNELSGNPFVLSISMGNVIMRAETAAISALACYQAIIGNWRINLGEK